MKSQLLKNDIWQGHPEVIEKGGSNQTYEENGVQVLGS